MARFFCLWLVFFSLGVAFSEEPTPQPSILPSVPNDELPPQHFPVKPSPDDLFPRHLKRPEVNLSSFGAYVRQQSRATYHELHLKGEARLCVFESRGDTAEAREKSALQLWERLADTLADGMEYTREKKTLENLTDTQVKFCQVIKLKKPTSQHETESKELAFDTVNAFYRTFYKDEFALLHKERSIELCITDDEGATREEREAKTKEKWEIAAKALADGENFTKSELKASASGERNVTVCGTVTL